MWTAAKRNPPGKSWFHAPYTIHHAKGKEVLRVNQEQNGGKWMLLGEYDFDSGTSGNVVLSNDANEFVVADAVEFVPAQAPFPSSACLELPDDSYTTSLNTPNESLPPSQ